MQLLRSAASFVQASALIGRYLNLWRDKSPDALGAGRTIEVYWRGTSNEEPVTNGSGGPSKIGNGQLAGGE
jgi:hypothetical protein